MEGILGEWERQGLVRAVVNGTREEDWARVRALAERWPRLIPAYGLHPWQVGTRSRDWQATWLKLLEDKRAVVGEIGLDRWIEGYDLPQQEEVFLWQWRVAAERNLPVSLHCLQAWGRLLELLRREPGPRCGFLLHSYGGPREMIPSFAKLGAYFSISGYFAHARKERQREAFRHVPPERLLIETDAPDMLPPEECIEFPLADEASGKAINHPANLGAIYRFVAGWFDVPVEALAERVAENFQRLFGTR